MPNVIFLMGVSSSGKSTVAQALQKLSADKYSIVGFDYAVESLPKNFWPGGINEKEGFYYEEVKSEHGTYPELRHGAVGRNFLKEMLDEIIVKANSGENLIVDYVISEEDKALLLSKIDNCQVTQIGIKPPLEVVVRREELRSDRKKGIAEAAYKSFYNGKFFDCIIDTSKLDAATAATQILDVIRGNSSSIKPS